MRFLLAFLLVFGWTMHVQASPVPKTQIDTVKAKKKQIIKTDSAKIDFRKIDEQAVTKYSKQKAFIYDDVTPEGLSWWQRFWIWLAYILHKIFSGDSSTDSGFTKILFIFLKWFLIALGVAIVTFIVVKVLGLDLKLLMGKSKDVDVPYEESLENIHEINFDEQLENAILNGNYRLAVRLLYLKTLKHLSDNNLIDWQLEKTNNAYVLEIADENYKREFKKLTYQFEYIWYGEFFIDQNSFKPINQSFQEFNQKTK